MGGTLSVKLENGLVVVEFEEEIVSVCFNVLEVVGDEGLLELCRADGGAEYA